MAVRVLLTGATGYLGRYVAAAAPRGPVELIVPGRGGELGLELRDPGTIARSITVLAPDLVLHLAALSTIAGCEGDPGLALQVNAYATRELCARVPRVLYASTDLVFGGDRAPYGAGDPPRPRSVYGRTKARGEEAVVASGRGLVVRLPLLFGRSFDGARGATDMIRRAAAANGAVTLFTDEFRTPLHAADAAAALWRLALSTQTGIVHAAGRERVSRFDLGQRFLAATGLSGVILVPAPCTSPLRPKDVSLRSDEPSLRPLDAALADS